MKLYKIVVVGRRKKWGVGISDLRKGFVTFHNVL